MFQLQDVCDTLDGINSDILQIAHERHSKAQTDNRAVAI